MLTMADGPVDNLPPGKDAYGGYVNRSGIGITYPQMVAKFPHSLHLSITTDGSRAMCADVESGAMSDWSGYDYGYCSVSSVNALVAKFGRPKRLWTAHYDPKYGSHVCSPACWPGLVTSADGTQWTDHGPWDESLLNDDFFTIVAPKPLPPEAETMDDNTFVRWAYMSILCRPVDAVGFKANMDWLNAGGARSQVYTNLCDSPEGQAVTAAKRKSLGLP